MPQAIIEVNASVGSDNDLPIDTSVQLSNDDVGDETTYKWEVVDQPPGAADSLSSTAIENPTITPKKEGTYLIRLTVDEGLPSEAIDTVILGIRQLKSFVRVPAKGEELEDDSTTGWSAAANAYLRAHDDQVFGGKQIIVGVAGASVPLGGTIVVAADVSTIKSTLPGEELLPTFETANASDAAEVNGPLGIVISKPDGTAPSLAGDLILVQVQGLVTGTAGLPAEGQLVFLSNAGLPASTPGDETRIIGIVLDTAESAWWFDPGDNSSAVAAITRVQTDARVPIIATDFTLDSSTLWTEVNVGGPAVRQFLGAGSETIAAPVRGVFRTTASKGLRLKGFEFIWSVSAVNVAVDVTALLVRLNFNGDGSIPTVTVPVATTWQAPHTTPAARKTIADYTGTLLLDTPVFLDETSHHTIGFSVDDTAGGSAVVTLFGAFALVDRAMNDIV